MHQMPRSLGWKLGASFACVLVLFAVSVAAAVWSVSRQDSAASHVDRVVTPTLIAADDVRTAAADMHFSQTLYVLQGTPAARRDFAADRRAFADAVSVLRARATEPADRRAVAAVAARARAFDALDGRIWQLVESDRGADAAALAGGPEDEATDALVTSLSALQHSLRVRESETAAQSSSDASASLALLVALGVAALLVSTALAFWLARRLTGSAREMLEAAEGIAEGDIDQRLEARSADELGQTAEAFQRMIAYLQRMAASARSIAAGDLTTDIVPKSERDVLGHAFHDMVVNLRVLIGDVRSSSVAMAGASQEMAATSQEAGSAVAEIAESIAAVAAGAQRQAETVSEVRTTAEESAEAAAQMSAVAADGVTAAEVATQAISEVQESSASVAAAMQELSAKSGQIGGIVATITAIAGQTNLLALNAAIEAARAGAQGRGFAVVAEEVRKLAEESQAAAASIAQLIERIQAETRVTVEAVEVGNVRIERGVEAVADTRRSFVRIGEVVDDVASRIKQIADATADVAAVAEESSASAEEVSASTERTSAGTQQIAVSAQELARSADVLQEAVARFVMS